EICGAEALGEAPIDMCQGFARIARAALRPPEPRQARRTAELPRQRPMSASAVERALEVVRGDDAGRRRALGQAGLAFEAQQLGEAPALFVVLRSGERLVDRRQALSDLPSDGEALCERRQESCEVLDELGVALVLDTGAE